MKIFHYGDERISEREIMTAVASVVIGVGVISLPRSIASHTEAVDGWISILVSGIVAIFFAWLCGKLASRFPGQNFMEFVSSIVTKPVTVVLTIFFLVYMVWSVAYQIRSLGGIAKAYLFDRTPIEVLVLIFWLVVIYAISGSRATILRLNGMFLPIILFVSVAVILMNIGFMDIRNFKPLFQTSLPQYWKGMKDTFFSYTGYEVVMFYAFLVRHPKKVPKAAAIGMSIPVILYIAVYIAAIGAFGNTATQQIVDPFVEMAKEVEVPGEFFERFESIFFTIWIMTLFNTSAVMADITVMILGWLIPHLSKITWILILSPVIYLIAMAPASLTSVYQFGAASNLLAFVLITFLPTLLLLIAKWRGIKGHE